MNTNNTKGEHMDAYEAEVRNGLEAMEALSNKSQRLAKTAKRDAFIFLTFIALAVLGGGTYFFMSEFGSGDYLYETIDKKVDNVKALPQAESRDIFLSHVQSVLADGKLTTWEYFSIDSKYKTAMKPSDTARTKALVDGIAKKAEVARQSN